jgi:hypothetical protein
LCCTETEVPGTLAQPISSGYNSANRVDLCVLPEAKPFLVLDAVRGEWLCVTDADKEATCELCVLRRAADLDPHERERMRMILAGEAIWWVLDR